MGCLAEGTESIIVRLRRQALVVGALRHWVGQYHVDGFVIGGAAAVVRVAFLLRNCAFASAPLQGFFGGEA